MIEGLLVVGNCNGREVDVETKTKVEGDVGVLMKETGLREKLLPSIWFVGSEGFKLSELEDMPELHGQSDHIQNKGVICCGVFWCNLFCVANQHRGVGCLGIATVHLKHVWQWFGRGITFDDSVREMPGREHNTACA